MVHSLIVLALQVVAILGGTAPTSVPSNYVCVSSDVSGGNATTPGAVTVLSTFAALSIKAPFTGDANASNTAAVWFKKTSDALWKRAYPPYVDRRALLGGSANAYVNQARGSIVGLAANTSYDVHVCWTDADGVAGGQPVIATISTLSASPPTGSGTTRNITDNATLTTALGAMNPGDTLSFASGTYNAFTIARSGTAGAWIVLDGANVATVSGLAVTQNIALNANYIILKNFILSASDFNGIVIQASAHHIFIQDSTLQGISRLCADGPTTTHIGDKGISAVGSNTNIYLLRNTITGHANLASCVQVPGYNGPATAIGWEGITTLVVDANTITGNSMRDGISLDDDQVTENVDLSNNVVGGYVDDAVESKGGNINVRMWGNAITGDKAGTCLAGNANLDTMNYGPLYIFRNRCRVTTTNRDGLIVYKIHGSSTAGSTVVYLFHNSVDTSPAGATFNWDCYYIGGAPGAGTFENNICKTVGGLGDYGGATFDYNVNVANLFGCCTWWFMWNETTSYDTYALWKTGTGQEAHGTNSDPLFSDTALHISITSPAVNAGLVLDNFNSLDSFWPYLGVAPDIGAYESF